MKCGGVSEEEGVLSATGHHIHTLINAICGSYVQPNNNDTFHLHVLFHVTALLISVMGLVAMHGMVCCDGKQSA